jgi:hypothetical protein
MAERLLLLEAAAGVKGTCGYNFCDKSLGFQVLSSCHLISLVAQLQVATFHPK